MQIAEMNWMQVEAYLQSDDRVVVPLGSTEQHAYLSLCVDAILAERIAIEAAEPLGVPVFPVQPYGVTPYFSAYPGTITLRPRTYRRLIWDLLDSLGGTGFRRVLFVNGHGGNAVAEAFAGDWTKENAGVQVRFHHWWREPDTMAHARAIEAVATHASWMENFPWTRLEGVDMPSHAKPELDTSGTREMAPEMVRELLGDGSFGGSYQRSDEETAGLWEVAVRETRAAITQGWEDA